MNAPEPLSDEQLRAEFAKLYPLDYAIICAADRSVDVGVDTLGATLKLAMFATDTNVVIAARDAQWRAAMAAAVAEAVEAAVLGFAKHLHSLPAEHGWEVGPSRVKFDAGGRLESGPLWVTQDDTDRWARDYLRTHPTQPTQGATDAPQGA